MHLRHSAYADYAAQARLNFLEAAGLPFSKLKELMIGPILFREELVYRREVPLNEEVFVTCELTKAREDGSRWSFSQEVVRSDKVVAAVINVDGAWLDLSTRKLTAVPAEYIDKFMALGSNCEIEKA